MLPQKTPSSSPLAKASYSSHCALQAGDSLQLQFLDDPDRGRFRVTVIGYVDGCSLMISAPRMNGHILLLREGQQFVVRLLSGKQIIGFNSEVLKVYNNPFAYVHLKPPAEVLQYNVRNAYRVAVENIASIQVFETGKDMLNAGELRKHSTENKATEETVSGKTHDMSTTGCLLQLIRKLPEKNNYITVTTKVTVAEQERLLSIDAEICSHKETLVDEETLHMYGVRFLSMNDDKRLLLNCFVYEKLVHELFKD